MRSSRFQNTTSERLQEKEVGTDMRMVIAIFMLYQPLQLHAMLRQTNRPMMFVSYSLMQPVGSSPSRKPK